MQCPKCVSVIESAAPCLACSDCKASFHPECTRVETMDNFKKLTSRKKSAWKCDSCTVESSSTASHDSRGEQEVTLSTLIQNMGRDIGSQIAGVKTSIDGMQKQLEGVNNTIGVMQLTLNNLVTENEDRKKEYDLIVKENKELKSGMFNLQQQLRELDQYSRRDNIEIVGVPFSRGENVYTILQKLSAVLKIPFDSRNLSVAHRLPRRDGQDHPNIVARFIAREEKQTWMRAARDNSRRLTAAALSDSWPSTMVFINDHLTSHNKLILSRAKHLVREKRIAFAWVRDCKVFVKKTALQDCPPTVLRTMEDLDLLVKQ